MSFKKKIDDLKDPNELYELGNTYFENDEFDLAIKCYKKIVKIKPDYHKAWNKMGSTYIEKKEFDKAIKCFEKACVIIPNDHEAWHGLGSSYRNKGLYDQAVKYYKKALEIKKDSYAIWFGLGNAYYRLCEFDKSNSCKEIAKNAIECFKKVVELKPNDNDAWINFGAACTLFGEIDLAINCLNKSLEINPKDYLAWNNLGDAYYDKGLFNKAIECFRKAIDLDPDGYLAWGNIGLAFDKMGEHKQAKPCIKKALELSKDDYKFLCHMGYEYYEMRDFKQAREFYKKALEIEPDFEFALNNLALFDEFYNLSKERDTTKIQLKSADNNLALISGKEKRGETINEIELQRKDKLLEEINQLKQKNNILTNQIIKKDRQLLLSHENKEMIVCFEEIDTCVFFKRAEVKDYIKITKMISGLEIDYFKMAYENIIENKTFKEKLKEEIEKIENILLKNEIKDIFEGNILDTNAEAIKDWVNNAVNEIEYYCIFSVVKLIVTGVQIKTTKLEKEIKKKVRVLILASDPSNLSDLNSQEEVRLIKKKLESEGLFECYVELAVRKRELVHYLKKYKPNIIHFTGHGDVDGNINLKDDDIKGKADVISHEALADTLGLIKEHLQCVFLNACYTDLLAEKLKNSADCIIGNTREIHIQVAPYIAEGFYEDILKGTSVQEAIETARVHARNVLENDYPKLIKDIKKPKYVEGRKKPAEVYFVKNE